MEGGGAADDFAAAGHGVGEAGFEGGELGDGDVDLDEVSEGGGALVFATDGDDGGIDAVLLHVLVAAADLL